MIKYLFILINALTVLLYSFFGGDNGVTVSGNIPKTINAGQEVPIEIKVTKGSMSGFAKLQLDLPEGLSIKELDNKGANFSYIDGIAKWVWATLPAENEVIIKATLVAGSSALGLKTIGAKYSFVENNAKQVVEMVPIEITVEAASSTTSAENTTTTTTTPTTSTDPTTTEVTTPTTALNSNKEPEGNITVVRTIAKGNSEGEYIINLKIKKGGTKGFARYSDDLPDGLKAKAIAKDGSSFSVADGKIKFVWVSVLLKDELDLSYSITSDKSISLTLNGEYSYLEDNQSKKFLLPAEPLQINLDQNTSTTTATETKTTEPVATTTETVAIVKPTEVAVVTPTEIAVVSPTETAEATTTETLAATTPTETVNNNSNTVTETVAKNDGSLNYMVQIGAFTNANVTAFVLKRQFQISEPIRSEMQDGYSKFMVGSYNEYKDARDKREKIKNNNSIKSAFVVAYNYNKRITVQEALMISNQKWYK